jgi:hypothetical protein
MASGSFVSISVSIQNLSISGYSSCITYPFNKQKIDLSVGFSSNVNKRFVAYEGCGMAVLDMNCIGSLLVCKRGCNMMGQMWYSSKCAAKNGVPRGILWLRLVIRCSCRPLGILIDMCNLLLTGAGAGDADL